MPLLRLPAIAPDDFAIFRDQSGDPTTWAVSDRNPIGEHAAPSGWLGALPDNATHLVVWSGTLDDDLFGRDNPMTWIGPGRAALDAFIAEVTPILRDRGVRLLLRPHCRHVLGDATTAKSFLDSLDPGSPIGLALDISAVFEPSMLRAAADHCRRTFEILGPVADLVICSGASVEGDRVVPAALGEGPLDAGLLSRLCDEHCKPGTPVALMEERFDEQSSLLVGAGG